MAHSSSLALRDPGEWLGDWHPLAEQLGSADGLIALGSLTRRLELPAVHDERSLRSFLRRYHATILLGLELPSIRRARLHAAAHQFRELVAFDLWLANDSRLRGFGEASRRVGQTQLQKLRPLRDARLVQKYLRAVEGGRAHGWHTLVYGVTLEVYSLPLRQGLLGYAHQTTRGFIYAAARMLRLSERRCREIFEEQCAGLPQKVEVMFPEKVSV